MRVLFALGGTCAALGLFGFTLLSQSQGAAGSIIGRSAPEFPSLDPANWAGRPTSMSSLRGRVVLLNVWTFGCINCERTLPWVRSTYERYKAGGLAVVGVHSPEFDREREIAAVEQARKRYGLEYPSFIDNGHVYWRALYNQYWPALYLIDKTGKIRALQVGEVHDGDEAALNLDRQIGALLSEPAPDTQRH
jgi:thiol-disulfide isomerase/thioredoxin